jgi:predicted nucleotidyltransferase
MLENAPNIVHAINEHILSKSNTSLAIVTDLSQILNIYLFGSHLHGTANSDSDYDFIAILDPEQYFDGSDMYEFTHVINDQMISININTYHIRYFVDCLLREQQVWAITCCFTPYDFIYKQNRPLSCVIDLTKLKKSALNEAGRNLGRAKRLWSENDLNRKYDSKKNIIHGFRKLYYARQLINHSKIVDFTEGNHLYDEIIVNSDHSWEYYETKYFTMFNDLAHEIKHFPQICNENDLVGFIQHHGIQALTRIFSIQINQSFSNDHLFIVRKSCSDFCCISFCCSCQSAYTHLTMLTRVFVITYIVFFI